jgi:hypothetical protein
MEFNKLYESVKAAISSADDKLSEFLDKRAKGAANIAATSKKKGGYSLLSAEHFDAKERPYADCVKHKNDKEYVHKKTNEALDKLKEWDKMSQKQFQALTGVLEVYGEVYIRMIKPNSIKTDKK